MPIDPPNKDSPPKWARTLVSAANSRNRAREGKEQRSIEQFSMTDLSAVWEECRGCCAVSGLAFSLQIVGNGQAKRPFAPSLDRIDRHKPYQRDNVRLVVSIANFAMNAWGDEPLLQLASALHKKSGDRAPPTERAPADADLDSMATTDAEFIETDVGTVVFPPRPDMRRPLVDLLQQGPLSSQMLEDALAKQFSVTDHMRAALLQNNCPAWRNHVAWVLVDLGRTGTGQIERIASQNRPGGGSMGIYRLFTKDFGTAQAFSSTSRAATI